MVVGHFYYYGNLKQNPPPAHQSDNMDVSDDATKISRIFHWSCVEFHTNRFSFRECGKELIETGADVVAHLAGFFLAFRQIESVFYQISALAIMYALLYHSMLSLKSFLTDPKMMPAQLRRCFTTVSFIFSTRHPMK